MATYTYALRKTMSSGMEEAQFNVLTLKEKCRRPFQNMG
jgi:hypothetical protein